MSDGRDSAAGETDRAVHRRDWTVAGGLVAISALLRFHGLDHQSLWTDEVSSLALIQGDWAAVRGALAQDVHPPLYFLLLKAWTAAFGLSEVGVRSLSALLGVVATGLLFRVGRRLFDLRVATFAALLFATSLFQIYYAQEARSYALLACLAIGSMDALSLLLSRGRAGRSVSGALAYYVLVSVAMLYAHYFGAFILLAQAGIVAFLAIDALRASGAAALSSLRAPSLGMLAVGVAFLPWLPVFRGQLERVQHGFWIPPITLDVLARTPGIFVGVRRPPWAQAPHWEEIAIAFAVLFAIGAGLSLFRGGRWLPGFPGLEQVEPPDSNNSVRAISFVLIWLLLPVAAAWTLSALASTHIYTQRNLIAAQPALCLLSAVIFTRLPGRWLKVTLAAALLAGSLGQLPWYYDAPHKGRWRELVRFVDRWSGPKDGVAFFTHFVKQSFDFHRMQAEGGPYPFVDLRQTAPPREARVWLVKAHARGHNFGDVLNKMAAWGYEPENSWRFSQAELLLFVRSPAPKSR